MLGGIVGVTRFVLSALLMSVAGCAASKPATDYTYQDVPPDQIANRIFLADAIAAVEGCEPPFADVREHRPNFVSPLPADSCGGEARAAKSREYVEAVTRITELHDTVVREWNVRLESDPEAAEKRAADVVLLDCLNRAGFAQRETGDPSLRTFGVGAGEVAVNVAAQRCSEGTSYSSMVTAQRVRTLKSVLGRHESGINEIVKLRPALERYAHPGRA